MDTNNDTLNAVVTKATEAGKKGFQTYMEMMDKLMDSVVGLVKKDDSNKYAQVAASALDSKAARKIIPYVVLGSAVDFNILFLKRRHDRKKEKRMEKKLKKQKKALAKQEKELAKKK